MSLIEQIARIRILQHVAFWSISLYILLRNFQASSELELTDYIYTGVFSIFLITAVYINFLALIPKLFKRGKYVHYFFSSVLLICLMTFAQIYLFDFLVEWFFPGYYLISYFDYWNTLKYFVILVGISSLLHFSKSWFSLKASEAVLSKTEKEKLEAELDALKNQINPHFLFNSLNSIYSLVLKKSKHAPEALVRLSDSMRYIIYESNHDRVDLNMEIDFVKNYIELQKLRFSRKDTLDFKISGKIQKQEIAPLLLLPIMENCFKYGIKGETEMSFVEIKIDVNPTSVSLQTKNNIGQVDSVERDKPKGTGLKNLERRLNLIYPGKHRLNVSKTEDIFTVALNIEL